MTTLLDNELLKFPNIEKIDENTYFLKKDSSTKALEFEKNKYYIISIDDSETAKELIETTRVNWNQGQYLQSYFLKCELVTKLGSMIQINACGYDLINNIDLNDIYLNFWINSNIITILKCIS